jgi:hypothetical protein
MHGYHNYISVRLPFFLFDQFYVILPCKLLLSDYGGGRNMAARRENGINHITERGGSLRVAQKTKNNAAPFLKK